MADFEVPRKMPPDADQHPETEYVNRFEPDDDPPPSESGTPLSVHRRRVREPRQSVHEEEHDDTLRPQAPEYGMRDLQIYSALVQAAMHGAINAEMLEQGEPPQPSAVLAYAGLTMQLKRGRFRSAFNRIPPEVFAKAIRRAEEIVAPPVTPWPQRPKPRDQRQNSYDRLMSILSRLSEEEHVPKEAYFSWGRGVASFYHGPLAQKGARPESADWGLYYTEDLAHYPTTFARRLSATERRLLEYSFVRLDGIPHLDAPQDLAKIARALPKDTPLLCFTSNTEAIALRAHPNLDPQRLEYRSWQRQTLLLFNLILLHDLRTAGKVTSGGLLKTLSNYSAQTFEKHLENLHEKLGANAGVLKRSRNNPDAYKTYFQIAENALILDARPKVADFTVDIGQDNLGSDDEL